MKILVFGMGYSSGAVARALRAVGTPDLAVVGTTRTPGQAEALGRDGYRMHVFDGRAPSATVGPDIETATHILVSIAPDGNVDPTLSHHGAQIAGAPRLEWIGYFSTVGVYGDAGGEWVDEGTACRPVNPRSQRRLRAEEDWRELAEGRGVPLAILRLAGIYGPGRSAFDKLRQGTARRAVKPGQVFNRIHVADIGRIGALAARRRLAGTYNVADDFPAPPQDVIAHAAGLMGVAPPPEVTFEDAEMTPMARSFYADNKRVANAAIKRALGIEMLYGDYRAGLEAIWRTND